MLLLSSMLVFTVSDTRGQSSTVSNSKSSNGNINMPTFQEANLTVPIQASWIGANGTVYAGMNQTLYKSPDQGVTWQPLIIFNSSNPQTPTYVNSVWVNQLNYIFVSPDPNAATDELGLWRSTNGGQTWSNVLPLPVGCTILSMDEETNGSLFAGIYTTTDQFGNPVGNASILKSTNFGATWQTVYYDSGARHIHCIAVDKANNYVYASVGDLRVAPYWTAYTLLSTNEGKNWTQILTTPQMLAVLPIDAKAANGTLVPVARLFATDFDNGQIYRTTNDQNFSLVLDTGAQSYGFWMRQNDINGNLYASFVGGESSVRNAGIYTSSDSGLTWAQYKTFVINSSYLGSNAASNFQQGFMYYDLKLNSGWQNGTKIYPNYAFANTSFLVVRGASNQIYYRTYNATSAAWSSTWTGLPGSTLDSPATVVCGNELYIVVRGSDGNTLWFSNVNLTDGTFGGWQWISGTTPSAPTLTSNGTALTLVVRGADNSIYYRLYTIQNSTWAPWRGFPAGSTCDQIAAVMQGNVLTVVVRGFSATDPSGNATLWQSTMNLDTGVFSGWNWMAGSALSSPTLTNWQNGTGYSLVVQGADNSIYINQYTNSTWQGWYRLPQGSTNISPAATVIGNQLYMVVVGVDKVTLWTGNLNLNSNVFSGWSWISGTTSSKPTLTS
jgi:hypothetical protein